MGTKTKLALDLGPLLVFFIAYRTKGLLAATAAIIVATLVSLAVTYHKERRLAPMPLISGIAITVLGVLTLLLQDEVFIKMKPTLVNSLFSITLLIGLYVNKPLLKYLLQDAMSITEEGWRKLSLRWGIYFLFLACLNEFIWRNFSTDFWVDFKVFGMFSLTMIFTLCQIPLIKKHWVEKGES